MSGDETESEPSTSLLQTVTPDVVRRSFALKFAIVLLILGVSIGSIGLFATETVKKNTQATVESQYENQALQQADLIEQWIDRNRLSTKLVSSDSYWSGENITRLDLATEQSELRGEVHEIHLVSSQISGTTIVASTSLESGTDVNQAGRGWMTNETFNRTGDVSKSSTYETDGTHVVGFASPVRSSDNRLVIIEYELDGIASSLRQAASDGGFTQVVDSSGTVTIDQPVSGEQGVGEEILTSYSQGERDRPIEAGNSLRNETQNSGVISRMEANQHVIDDLYVVGYSPIEGTDWVVLSHASYSEVFGFVQAIQRWGLIATLIQIILIGGVGATLGYSTSSSIKRLTRKTEQMREGDLDVELQSSRIDDIGELYRGFADMRDSLENQIDEAERARKEAEVSRAEALEMNNYLQEKATEFSRAMEATAAGDMTQRMETDGENESMDQIAEQFNEMIEELEKTTGQLKSFADEVAESGDVVLSSAESVKDAAEQVAESVQKISDDAYEQKDRLQDVSENLDDLVATLEEIDASDDSVDLGDSLDQFRSVATVIQQTADTSEEMMAESENVAGAAEEQAAELNEVSSRADKLERYARPLGDILNRFETEAEHEFVFSGGPSQSSREEDE